jgi:hypothetical protein
MAEEYIWQRERELLDYIRLNVTDPESRSTVQTDTFTATAGQTQFTLTQARVNAVYDTITVDLVVKRKGFDYTVSYGEGAAPTILTLHTAASVGDSVVVQYLYGQSMVEREYSRTDSQIPRIVMMFLTGSEEPASLGDLGDGGALTSYFNVSYRIEVRDKYATRARTIASKVYNLGQKFRHTSAYGVLFSQAVDLQNFDYDIEKNAYVWQMTFSLSYDLSFQ